MKLFVLVLYMCSGVANTCLQPFVFEEKFNSAYDCMIKGYEEGKDKIIEIGPDDVNKYDMYIKFNCLAEEVIIPPKKPVRELKT